MAYAYMKIYEHSDGSKNYDVVVFEDDTADVIIPCMSLSRAEELIDALANNGTEIFVSRTTYF